MAEKIASDLTSMYMRAANFWEQQAISAGLEIGALRARLAELEPSIETEEIPIVDTEEVE